MWIRQPEPAWTPPPRVKGSRAPSVPPPHDPETLDWLAARESVDLDAAAQLDVDNRSRRRWVRARTKKPAGAALAVAARRDAAAAAAHAPPRCETARAEAIETVALMRAHRRLAPLEAVDPHLQPRLRVDGVFRDECGRADPLAWTATRCRR